MEKSIIPISINYFIVYSSNTKYWYIESLILLISYLSIYIFMSSILFNYQARELKIQMINQITHI